MIPPRLRRGPFAPLPAAGTQGAAPPPSGRRQRTSVRCDGRPARRGPACKPPAEAHQGGRPPPPRASGAPPRRAAGRPCGPSPCTIPFLTPPQKNPPPDHHDPTEELFFIRLRHPRKNTLKRAIGRLIVSHGAVLRHLYGVLHRKPLPLRPVLLISAHATFRYQSAYSTPHSAAVMPTSGTP